MKTRLRITVFLTLLVLPQMVTGHPMGNFSINHHSRIRVSTGAISITTILDFAEIATFQMVPDPRRASEHAEEWASRLHLQAGGRTLPLKLRSVRSDINPAPAGLPTLRVQLELESLWTGGDVELNFRDDNYPDRIGWKEVVIEADPSLVFPKGNPYASDRSRGLTAYPEDLLSSAPEMVLASVRIAPAGTASAGSFQPAEIVMVLAFIVPACLFVLYFIRKEPVR
jgi:hypothetical protein